MGEIMLQAYYLRGKSYDTENKNRNAGQFK